MANEILNGNELIIQGGLEAGFSLYTGYPGSPLADYFNILNHKKDLLHQIGARVVLANSEANAAAMASGAKQAGRDVCVAMKSMGLHVAADALSVGNFANPHKPEIDKSTGKEKYPGVVIVVGDDPWSMSTSTPADSRYLYKHLHIPFLEPSTPQELKDWMKEALEISRESSVYQGLLLTTMMAEGGGRVELGEIADLPPHSKTLDPKQFDLSKNVMVPPNSLMADHSMIVERFPKVLEVLEEKALDRIFGKIESRVGVISAGVIFETLKQVFDDQDLGGKASLYKLAGSYPLIPNTLLPYLRGVDRLIVVEEKRGFLETEIREFVQNHGLQIEILGKKFGDDEGFPAFGGLNYEIIHEKLAKLFPRDQDKNECGFKLEIDLPKRLPTFCPGCPHRETLSLLKDLRKTLDKEGVQLLSHGDVGCYSLSFLPPFKEMHNLSAMGQGGALGAGVDIFVDNPSVVLMGDSTFFHSGLTNISNSQQLGHNITYIILDNDNTAMTGHQMTPRTGVSVEGETRPRQDIIKLVKAMGVDEVVEVSPSDRYFYQNLLKELVKKSGTKVIVSNKECGLTFHGRRKSLERKMFKSGETIPKKAFYQINTDACEDCRECVESTGCPGLTKTFDAYGDKVTIDPQICVADSYCTKLKACPSFELVEVMDYHPSKYKTAVSKSFGGLEIPLPKPEVGLDEIAAGRDYRVTVIGVGGSGVTTISRIIAEAAKEMGGRDDLDFKFMDQKGLAQRNGSVTSHLSIFSREKSHGPVNPEGNVDLLFSPDLLEGCRAINFLKSSGMAIIDEDYQVPLTVMLDRGEESDVIDAPTLRDTLQSSLKEHLVLSNAKKMASEYFGRDVYASAILLGQAFQKGLLPFSLQNMIDAFSKAINKNEVEKNISAFHLGRQWILDKEALPVISNEKPATFWRQSLSEGLPQWIDTDKVIAKFINKSESLIEKIPQINPDYIKNYLHDSAIYDCGKSLDALSEDLLKVARLYEDPEELKIALRTVAKTYWVKDEVFVSHLMISPMKEGRDAAAYKELGSGFKITRINRPAFSIAGKVIEFDISPKLWMLKIMRQARFLRFLLPTWHLKERKLNKYVREQVLSGLQSASNRKSALKKLENIKGYREVRYQSANERGVEL